MSENITENNINTNMISQIISFDDTNLSTTGVLLKFRCHAYDPSWGLRDHRYIFSSGKIVTSGGPFNFKLANQNFCILDITDNYYNPIENQQIVAEELVSYEITLCDIVLPNIVLDSYFGGRISAYRYFYVALNNVDTATGIGYSLRTNNKFTPAGVVFRVAVERQFTDESSKYFLSFSAKCPIYAKFNPTKTIRFSVILPNGETFKNAAKEWYPPCRPNPLLQISASFSFRRLGDVGIMNTTIGNNDNLNLIKMEKKLIQQERRLLEQTKKLLDTTVKSGRQNTMQRVPDSRENFTMPYMRY